MDRVDKTKCHPDGTICPFFGKVGAAASFSATEGIYHGDGTRCPLWSFTRLKSETGDTSSSPTASPQRPRAPRTFTAPSTAQDADAEDFFLEMTSRASRRPPPIPQVHTNLQRVIDKLRAPNITRSFIIRSLVPFLTSTYGADLAQLNLDKGAWSETIASADLLIRAVNRA